MVSNSFGTEASMKSIDYVVRSAKREFLSHLDNRFDQADPKQRRVVVYALT